MGKMMSNARNKMPRKVAAVLALAVLGVMAWTQSAHADKLNISPLITAKKDPVVDIMLGKAEMVDIGSDVADVLVANPSIVDVMAVKSDRLYLVGTSLGDTNIITLDEQGNVLKKINVHVQMDTVKLSAIVDDLYPNESVQIRALTDQIVLTGNVSTPAASNGIARLVAEYASEVSGQSARSVDEAVTNMLKVHGEQQVMLRVKIVEVARNALKDLGLEANIGRATTGEFPNLGSLAGSIATTPGIGLTNPVPLAMGVLNYLSGDFGPMQFVARALEEEGILNTLAEPNLTAISGQQAGFLAGGEFPIPTERDRDGNIVYEFKPFGVSLNFRPIVQSEERITLELTTEVSTASFDQGLQLNNINIPTFNVRRANTIVELPSGGTLMIAGLLQSNSLSNLTQLPGVKDIPVVGDLIKSDSFTRNESEVVVMITPYLVKPFAHNQSAQAAVPHDHVAALSMEELEDHEIIRHAARPVATAPDPAPRKPDMPAQALAADRQENKLNKVFGNYVRRAYGQDAHEQLRSQGNYGYMVD